MADQPDLRVEPLEPCVRETEADRGEDPSAVLADRAGEADERSQFRARSPGKPGGEVLGSERGVVEVVEQAQLLLQQERPKEAAVGQRDLAERGELGDRLA